MDDSPPRTQKAVFQPRFTLSLLYLAIFLCVFSVLAVAPELASFVSGFEEPASPEEAEAMRTEIRDAIRRAYAPRMPLAFGLAVGSLFLAAWRGWLPGIRPPQ